MKKITLFFALLFFTALNCSIQAAQSQIAICTAGNLATVASSYLTTVTNLTVTGVVDARDFTTMRDEMPLLEVVDLSGATVAAYSGPEGPEGTTIISYPANEIPAYAFYNQSTFEGKVSLLTFNYPALVTTIGDYAFKDCSGLIGVLNIPTSVTTIGDLAFAYCSGFSGSLILPSSVTTIGALAFYSCSGFSGTLTISSSVKTIGESAFYGCFGFTGSLTIPSSVTTIGNYAFYGCSGFTGTLTIPLSVSSIGGYGFYDCTGLSSILAYKATPVDLSGNSDVFGLLNIATPLHVPVGSKSLYQTAFQWRDFTNIVEDLPTSLNEVLSSTISIFPNPVTSFIMVSELSSITTDNTVNLSVIDVTGATVLVKEFKPNGNSLSVDVRTLKNGIYFINIQTSNGSVVKRFVKE